MARPLGCSNQQSVRVASSDSVTSFLASVIIDEVRRVEQVCAAILGDHAETSLRHSTLYGPFEVLELVLEDRGNDSESTSLHLAVAVGVGLDVESDLATSFH